MQQEEWGLPVGDFWMGWVRVTLRIGKRPEMALLWWRWGGWYVSGGAFWDPDNFFLSRPSL